MTHISHTCGYDPSKQPLRATYEHWRECKHRDCRERMKNWVALRQYFAEKREERVS